MSKVDVLSCHLNLVLGFENAASLLESAWLEISPIALDMDKLKLTGLNLGRVFNYR